MLNRNLYLVGVAGALLVLGLGFLFGARGQADVRKFTGTLIAAEDNKITVRGAFYPVPDQVPERFRAGRDLTFRTDGTTKILAIRLELPTEEKLAQASGQLQRFKLNELPRKETPGSIEELRGLIGKGMVLVDASFSSSILKAKEPVAAAVIYRHLPMPYSVKP